MNEELLFLMSIKLQGFRVPYFSLVTSRGYWQCTEFTFLPAMVTVSCFLRPRPAACEGPSSPLSGPASCCPFPAGEPSLNGLVTTTRLSCFKPNRGTRYNVYSITSSTENLFTIWSVKYKRQQFSYPSPHIAGTHTGGLADCDGKIISFALAALQCHSFLLCPLLVLLHLLNATQRKQWTNQEAWESKRDHHGNILQTCISTLNVTDTSLPREHLSSPCTSSWALHSSCGEPRSSCPAPSPSQDPSWAACHWESRREHIRLLTRTKKYSHVF